MSIISWLCWLTGAGPCDIGVWGGRVTQWSAVVAVWSFRVERGDYNSEQW